MSQVIVLGGGLSGLSAAHTVLERGGRVCIIDKKAFFGGNSTKATSGINGALTKTQRKLGIKDSVEAFYEDTKESARELFRPDLAEVLTGESGPSVEWLQDKFGLDLSLVSRLGGHSFQRTHRGKERFPGMTITYALMEKMEEFATEIPDRVRIIMKARAHELITGPDGDVCGVRYTKEDGTVGEEHGPVIIATGGYGADFSKDSLLARYRPDCLPLSTTNGDHCTGDGIKIAEKVGAGLADMESVQVHPTGLVDPADPEAKVKFLAAEALRGCGGLLLDRHGKRFCDELGHRDYVSEQMFKHDGPYHLILNGAASREIEWHCKHYTGRGLMKKIESGRDLAAHIKVNPRDLEKTFNQYNKVASEKSCPFGKRFFHNMPWKMNDYFYVAHVTPLVHYTMGGLYMGPDASVLQPSGEPVQGLWAAGEVMGGTHGANRLGGSSLLDCVVFGRVAGRSSAAYLLDKLLGGGATATRRVGSIANHLTGGFSVQVTPRKSGVTLDFSWDGEGGVAAPPPPAPSPPPAASAEAPPAAPAQATYTVADVAKHNTEDDCWVIVNGRVLDVTKFMPDHPGGKKAIMLFAGRDATAEFNMLHKPDVVDKYAPDSIIGTLAE